MGYGGLTGAGVTSPPSRMLSDGSRRCGPAHRRTIRPTGSRLGSIGGIAGAGSFWPYGSRLAGSGCARSTQPALANVAHRPPRLAPVGTVQALQTSIRSADRGSVVNATSTSSVSAPRTPSRYAAEVKVRAAALVRLTSPHPPTTHAGFRRRPW
jgi:hypothetical protein